ncbi:MAG: MotA/TolQ/ExbB proton channel family protein [Gemmatimonadota bacterium]
MTDEHSPDAEAPENGSEDEARSEYRAAADAAAAAGRSHQSQAKKSRRATPMEALIPFLSGLVFTVLLQLVIANAVAETAYLYRLFRPPGGWVMSVVPALIVFVLIWTLVDLGFKWIEGLRNEADLDVREIRKLPRTVAQESVTATQRRLMQMDGRERPVLRRLLWLLHYLETHDDAQRTHELLRHQSDLDADTAAAGYRTSKLFIWAMPILGFVGTVLGISLAVGGFSEFLTTNLNIEDVSRVTSELGNVASGLSFAFDTTLLGLLAGLVANVMSSIVQKRDERFFTRLDELGLSIVANRQDAVGSAKPRSKGGSHLLAADFEASMQARLEEIGSLVDRTRNVMQGLSETSARMNAGLGESMAGVRQNVEQLGTNLRGVTKALETESANQAKVEEAVHKLSEAIDTFGEGLADLRAEQEMLGPVLKQLAGPLELRLVPGQRGGSQAD